MIAIRSRRWYYLLCHPYSLFCFAVVWRYRLAFEIPGVAKIADLSIAIGIVLASILFWSGYILLKEKYIIFISQKCFGKIKTTDNNNILLPSWGFWFFFFLALIIIISIFSTDYLFYKGDFHRIFFTHYRMKESGEIGAVWHPLLLSTIRYFLMFFRHIPIFIALPLLFEALNNKRAINSLTIIASYSLVILSLTQISLIGNRTFPAAALLATILLVFTTFLYSTRRLYKIAIPLLLIFTCYTILFILFLPVFRNLGFHEFMTKSQKVFTQTGIKTLYAGLLAKTKSVEVPTSLKVEEKSNNIHSKIKSDDNVLSETENHDSVYESLQFLFGTDTRSMTSSEKSKLLIEEKNFLQNYPVTYSISKEIAWVMMYYGRHKEYVGMFNNPRYVFYTLLPSRIKDKSLTHVGNIVGKDKWGESSPSNSVVGPFGEGYVSYGFIGGYFYWSIFALISGLLSKFAIVCLFTKNPRFELLPLSLFILVIGHHLMWQGLSAFIHPLCGFLTLIIFYAVIVRVIESKKHSSNI
ncbi:MAG: hypothetical protein LBE13_14350 [Bacteroidales bacterium]|nr:hypothetical protein [Bacteroidales bacterium]